MTSENNVSTRPDWLDDNFLKICVRNDIGASNIEEILLNYVNVQYAIPKGENYCSIILRVIVKFDLNSKQQNGNSTPNEGSYIIKVPCDNDIFTVFVEKMYCFEKEVDMYTNALPKFELILKEAGLETTLGCRCLYVRSDIGVYVMEDLVAQNYDVKNRLKGLDLKHTNLAIFKLARLHAASMKYLEENSHTDLPAYYLNGLVCRLEDEEDRKLIDPIVGELTISGKVDELADILNVRQGYDKEARLLKESTNHIYNITVDIFQFKPGNKWNALLHGDFWMNNILYKLDDEGKPIDAKMIDLQFSYINSIANDLIYFIISSPSDEVKKNNFEDVINYYHQSLIETLDKVGYKGFKPTLQQLHEELLSSSPIFPFVLSQLLTLVKMDHGSEANDRSGSEALSHKEILSVMEMSKRNPLYVESLFINIDLFKRIGYFDHLAAVLNEYKLKTV